MKAVPSLPDVSSPDVLAELYGQLSAVYGRLAEELAKRSQPAKLEALQPGADEVLDSKGAAKAIGRSLDWFGRHREAYGSALVSREGERPRYSRRLLERQLELVNRARTRHT